MVNLQDVLLSRSAARLGLFLCERMTPKTGYRLADFLAERIANRRGMPMIQAIRSNQWMISGGKLSSPQLDEAVREVMRQTGRSFFNLFHYHDNQDALQEFIAPNNIVEDLIKMSLNKERGLIILAMHMSNMDLVGQAVIPRGNAFGLSLSETTDAIEWQHALRRNTGIEILPATNANMRQVIRRLRQGEFLLTGFDRPINNTKYKPCFFGHPANLPVFYVPLALRAQVPVIVVATVMKDDGRCHVYSSDFIEFEPHKDRETELLQNAERVLRVAEEFVSLAPQQWLVIHPIWPQFNGKVH